MSELVERISPISSPFVCQNNHLERFLVFGRTLCEDLFLAYVNFSSNKDLVPEFGYGVSDPLNIYKRVEVPNGGSILEQEILFIEENQLRYAETVFSDFRINFILTNEEAKLSLMSIAMGENTTIKEYSGGSASFLKIPISEPLFQLPLGQEKYDAREFQEEILGEIARANTPSRLYSSSACIILGKNGEFDYSTINARALNIKNSAGLKLV